VTARRACALVAVGAVLAIVGCGADSDPEDAQTRPPPAAGAGTGAERAAVAWWNALRYQQADRLIGMLTPAARRGVDVAATRRVVVNRFGSWAGPTQATPLYWERTGHGIKVYMRIDGGNYVGRVLVKRGAIMLALPLVERDHRWLVDDSAWLREQVIEYVHLERVKAKLLRQLKKEGKR
jgi:hypothetical protein